MLPSNIEKYLKNMKPKPLTKKEQNMLWSKIEKDIRPRWGGSFSIFRQRFALATFLTLAIIATSGATVLAADSAKPGDLLFPIDIAVEKVQLVISFGEKKNELKIKFSEERVEEARAVLISEPSLSTATSTSSEDIQKAEQALSTALEYLEKTKSELEEKDNSFAAEALGGVINKLNKLAEEHVENLEKVKIKIKDNGRKIKIEIEASSEGIKTKFKFEKKENKKNRDKSDKEKIKIKIELEGEDEEGEEHEEKRGKDKITICHIPPGNPNKAKTVKIAEPALEAHLAHGDNVGECEDEEDDEDDEDEDEEEEEEDEDTVAPVISDVISNIATSTAEISWNTDEPSDSKVLYATTTPIIIPNATVVSSTALVINHSLSLVGLNASTTYYFVVSSTDEAANTATSTEASFNTL